jgi:MFS family permease
MHYLDKNMSKGMTAILISRALLFVVGGLLGIFTPIFIYKVLGENVQLALLYFATASCLYVLSVPILIRYVDRMGFKYALILSGIVGAGYHFMFYLQDTRMISMSVFLITSILLLSIYRMTYWIPFHTEFTRLGDYQDRGRQISLFSASSMLLGIFLPALSAIMIGWFGFEFVFIISVGVMIISTLPYFWIPFIPETYSWSVRQTWQEFFCRCRSKVAIAFIAEGAENIIALYLWPIFLYQLFKGNLLDVGTVSALIIAGTITLQLLVGRFIDRSKKIDSTLKWGSALYALGWIVKMFAVTALQVFVVGVYHAISKIFTYTPQQSLSYDISSENDQYVDEYTVLREMFINTGKTIGGLITVALSFVVSVQWLFIIGAIAALAFHFISDRDFDLKRCL